jgi:NTE family protein
MKRFSIAQGARSALHLLLASVTLSAMAQTAAPASSGTQRVEQRPRIGLVLSGGGARGAAHVGVLKVLEELRVPVDLIVGTSMGAIVGGSYASGMPVTEMERELKTINGHSLFTDNPPRSDLPMRRKADDESAYILPELGVQSDGIVLPKGIVTGVSVEAQLRKLVRFNTAPNFDRLPIPFRAIATDLGTGEMVILKDGTLVTAMRASMSVPGGMAPVQIGDRQLVDGGLVRNLGVDIARQIGADIVIAVNLGTPLLKPEQVTSVLSVTAQMINILTEQNVRQSLAQLQSQDILILPELGDFSATDFDNLIKTVPIGEAAARKVADRLRALTLPPEQYAALRAQQSPTAGDAITVVDAIRVEGTKRVNDQVVLQSMNTAPGQPLKQDTLDLDLRRIYGRGDFENVNYAIEDVDGKRTLVVKVTEKPQQHYARFGLQFEADVGKRADVNILASHRWKWLNRFGAEWRNDLVLGRDVLVATEFYQPLSENQYFFIAPQLKYTMRPFDVYADDLRIAEYQDQTYGARFDVGANFTRYGEARLGVSIGERLFRQQSGALLVPSTGSISIRAAHLDVRFDQLEGINFPTSGWALAGGVYSEADAIGADVSYTRWRLAGTAAETIGRHTFEISGSAGGKLGDKPIPAYDQFSLGGFLNLSGLLRDQLRTERFQFGRFTYRTKLADIPLFEGMFFGASLEAARLSPPLVPIWRGDVVRGTLTVAAGAVYLGIDSPIGPLYLGFGWANPENRAVYLYLGRP